MKPAVMTPEQSDRVNLRFTVATIDGHTTVTVAGKINAANARPIRMRCLDEIAAGATAIVIDCAHVWEIDKVGMEQLLGLRNDATRQGIRVTIVGASVDVVAAFARWSLAGYFEFRESSTASHPSEGHR